MNLIVTDLEWNTASRGIKVDPALASRMMFEIIEIGAVRLAENLHVEDSFYRSVKPVLYKKIQRHVAAVTKRTQQSLKSGGDFPDVAEAFFLFAGAQPIIASWGSSDPDVLISNLRFHRLDDIRFRALNIQSVFSGLAEGASRGDQRSVEYALDFFRLPKDLPFHEAVSDARYAAIILQETLKHELESNGGTIESILSPYLYDPFLIRKVDQTLDLKRDQNAEEYLHSADFYCPACGRYLELKPSGVDQPSANWIEVRPKKRWYALAECSEHGDVEILVRRKHHGNCARLSIRLRLPEGLAMIPRAQSGSHGETVWVDRDLQEKTHS